MLTLYLFIQFMQGSNVSGIAVAEIEQHCKCGFTSQLITEAAFHCFTASPTTVTYRATLENSNFLPAIQNWIYADGILQIQNISIQIDKSCPVIISNLTEPDCIGMYMGENETQLRSNDDDRIISIICGGTGGLIALLIVVLLVIIVVTRHMYQTR